MSVTEKDTPHPGNVNKEAQCFLDAWHKDTQWLYIVVKKELRWGRFRESSFYSLIPVLPK